MSACSMFDVHKFKAKYKGFCSKVGTKWYYLCKFEFFFRSYGLTSITAATVQRLKIDKFVRPLIEKVDFIFLVPITMNV